jgi:Big-like domain-containing protein
MIHIRHTALVLVCVPAALLCAACSGKKSSTPSEPSPTQVTVTSVAVTGTNSFTEKGANAQLTATATLSNGTMENRTSTATWQSDNANVASVSAQGVVTANATGDATISATVSSVRGTRAINVRIPPRTSDPPVGQRLPLPDVQGFIFQTANARPDLLARSCPNGRKYENNPWLDYIVDALRTLDTRWGYNGKPTRSAGDNNGFPVIAAGDEIAYHFGRGPDQNSPDVYLIDILVGHCGDNPSLTFRHFTGEEPGFWTGANRLPSGNGVR